MLMHRNAKLEQLRSRLILVEGLLAICAIVMFFSTASWVGATNQVKEAIDQANQAIDRAKFMFYYVPVEQRFGVDDLESYLNRWQWKVGAYAEGKFDCSEMSAYLERELENEGYHTIIVTGETPSDRTEYHAWLLVETSKGKYMPVEATQYKLVKWDNLYFDRYFEYEHSFETIQDALEYDYAEFDWWEES